MPFIGIGVHLLVALFFAVHALRTGRPMYWLIILFSFPLLGSIAYFLVEYLPNSRIERGLRQATVTAVKTLDPTRALRETQQAFDLAPTAQNRMQFAKALLEAGYADKAVEQFDECLKGPFATDPEIRLGAATARIQNGDGNGAMALLLAIRQENMDFRPESVTLLLAQAYALTGRDQEARREFVAAVTRFGSIEARAEYAIWALRAGDDVTAHSMKGEIEDSMRHWNRHAHTMNRSIVRRLNEAFSATRPTAAGR